MGSNTTLIKKLRYFRKEVTKDFPLNQFILFGSRATGKAKKYSDVDLVLVSPKFRNLDFVERGAKMYDYWDLDYPVDFLCYTPDEFKKLSKNATLVREAVEKGIKIT